MIAIEDDHGIMLP